MTTSRELNKAAELIANLPPLMRSERERRWLSLRDMAAESGVGMRVIDRTLKGGLPTASHAIELLDWLALSHKQPDTPR